MKIALYNDRIDLPFYTRITGTPTHPDEVFDPKRHGRIKLTFNGEKTSLRKSWVWPILMGLRAIDFSVMAHVSVFPQTKRHRTFRTRSLQDCLYVQITNLTTKTDKRGVPVVVNTQGEITVENIYIGEIGNQYRLLENDQEVEGTTTLWKKFFTVILLNIKERASEDAREIRNKATVTEERYAFLSGIVP